MDEKQNALIAAAYEAAAKWAAVGPDLEDRSVLVQAHWLKMSEEIRALTPDDARAALNKMLAEARRETRIEAAKIASRTVPKDADFTSIWGEYEQGVDAAQHVIAAAILAKNEGET